MPGVLKNGIDWLTRPPEDLPKTFSERPLALFGAVTHRANEDPRAVGEADGCLLAQA